MSGQVARAQDGAISAQSLSVTAPNLTISGKAALAPDQTVSADISGTLKDASRASSSLAGTANFTLAANGPLAKPDVDLTVNGDGLAINGQQLAGLTVNAKGTLDPQALSASLNASGSLNGQPLQATAQLSSLDDGRYRVSDLALRQGPNAITGALTLTPAFLPIGKLDIAVEDIESLAALGGLEAAGDLNGAVDLTVSDGGQANAAVNLTGNQLSVSGNTLTGVKVDLAVADYLGKPAPDGHDHGSAIDASSLAVRDLKIALADAAPGIGITVDAGVNDVPASLAGTVTFPGQATEITLSRLSAEIPDAAIALPDPATIRLANGTTTLSGLTLSVGGGSVRLSGSAGETLDLALDLTSVPAAVANPFVPGLAASRNPRRHGARCRHAASPDATFAITATGLAVASRAPPMSRRSREPLRQLPERHADPGDRPARPRRRVARRIRLGRRNLISPPI